MADTTPSAPSTWKKGGALLRLGLPGRGRNLAEPLATILRAHRQRDEHEAGLVAQRSGLGRGAQDHGHHGDQVGVGAHRPAVPKSAKSRRQVALTPTAVAALQRQRARQLEERLAAGETWQDTDLVFTDVVGAPLNGIHVLRYKFAPLVKRTGLPTMRLHDLRHTCATLLLDQGINPKIVSEMLGHSTVAMTLDLYSHVLPMMQQSTVSALEAVLAAGTTNA